MLGLEGGTVELVGYDPGWRAAYEREATRLRSLIGGEEFVAIEHIGSTAIEGLRAKPIIDLLITVESLDRTDDLVSLLESNGYEHRHDERERRFLAKGSRSNRTHYCSIAEHGGEFHREKLAFREYLRANSDPAKKYERVKRELAARHGENRDAYTEAKGAFIECVLDEAMDER